MLNSVLNCVDSDFCVLRIFLSRINEQLPREADALMLQCLQPGHDGGKLLAGAL